MAGKASLGIIMKRSSLHYILLTSRFEQIWFPLSFWALFIIIGFIRGSEYIFDTTRAYLGTVIPLMGGITAAYAVLEDPALELRFSTPISAIQTLLERLLPTFTIQVLSALTFQIFAVYFGADFSPIGGLGDMQLLWLIPTISLMSFGCLMAFISTHAPIGASVVGLVWIVQLVARSWFADGAIGQYVLVFMGVFMPEHPALHANQIVLFSLSIAFLIASLELLRRQERYI
jgi:hypothetical protein